jgi:glucose dehydrogenase
VDTASVRRLDRAWEVRTGLPGIFEATPVVVDGAIYLSTPVAGGRQAVLKLDAATGERLWETRLEVEARRPHPTTANRGVAVHRGRVHLATLDARLVTLDAGSGRRLWEVRTADPGAGYQHKQAPLAHDGRVYLGVSGGPLGIRGWVKAFDAATGTALWTWHSIPSPEEGGWWGAWVDTLPGTSVGLGRDVAAERADSARLAGAWRSGGGAVWMTPTMDVGRGLLYVGVGNPAPELDGAARPGDNRWTSSVCAVRAEDGSTVWCRQYLPHDVWGMDAASPPFLFPYPAAGSAAGGGGGTGPGAGEGGTGGRGVLPAVGHFSKLGLFHAWDRRDGARLTLSENYVPHRNFLKRPTPEGVEMAPGIYGGTEWSPAAYSPLTGLAYAAALHAPGRYVVRGDGRPGFDLGPPEERYGVLVAMDPVEGRPAWTDRTERPLVGGVLATAGGLVFAGRLSGSLTAWDARSGRRLWSGGTAHGCASGPVTYRAGGRQYVAVACGGHFLGGGRGDQVVAFALPGPSSAMPGADSPE